MMLAPSVLFPVLVPVRVKVRFPVNAEYSVPELIELQRACARGVECAADGCQIEQAICGVTRADVPQSSSVEDEVPRRVAWMLQVRWRPACAAFHRKAAHREDATADIGDAV